MKTIKEYSAIINSAIAGMSYGEPKSLFNPISYTMEGEGKRLRPVLTLAVADALGVDVDKAVKPALGMELYHNFTLLHDDIMDNSPTRRGREAVWKKWDTASAILSGDTMLSVALDCVLHAYFTADKLIDMARCFNHTAIEVDRGQQYDMDFEHRAEVSLAEYIEMISLKTGALLAGSCCMGAICGGAGRDTLSAFHAYGINLGIAFQIQDDILDVYGDEATLGKPVGGDILNDKHTWLRISAKEMAPEAMRDLDGGNLSGSEKIEAVKAVYDNLDLRAKSSGEVERYLSRAVDALSSADLTDEAKRFFVDFAHSLIGRKK